jgi:hypothetical protein
MLLFKPLRRKRHPGRIGVNFFEGMDVKHTQNLILDAQRPNSTSEDIFSALEYPAIDGKFKNIRDPVSALMIIISRDTNDTFSILHTTLDRISEASLDEVKLQEHLKSWRDQLESTRKLASGLVKDFESFASEIISKKYATNSRSLTALVDEVKNNGRTVTTKVWRVTKGLRAEMSLLESRRGIAEAESVTRLTELAFIFIPLTFVSSIFSMQVNELSSGVPFSTFLIAASCATVLLYGTRLFLRSRPFVTCRRLFMDKARIWAHVPKGEPIPFLQFFFFCIRILFIIFRTPIRALWRMSRISTLSPFKRRKSGGALPSDSAKTAEV